MRFLFSLLVGVVLSFSVMPVADAAPKQKGSYAEIEAQKKVQKKVKAEISCGMDQPIRVAGFVTNPPFGWVDIVPGSGLQKEVYVNRGYAYDLFQSLAVKLQYRVRNIGYTSYLEALKDLRKGKVDVVVGGYYNRSVLGVGINLLTPGYMVNPIIPIFVKGKERPVETFADLQDLKGVVRQEEMIYPLIYTQLPKNFNLQQVSGSRKAFKMLLNNEVDYMLTSLYSAEAEVRRFKIVDEIYFSNKSLAKPELFFLFSSHSDCRQLKRQFAQELSNMQKDKEGYMRNFIQYIDDWGQTFKDDKGLLEEDTDEENRVMDDSQQLELSDSADVDKPLIDETMLKTQEMMRATE